MIFLIRKTFLNEDLINDQRRKSLIKTDNLVSINIGLISTLDLENDPSSNYLFNFSWGYQLAPNFWGEFSYGFSQINRFPDQNLTTALQIFSARIKYTFRVPLVDFIQPYAGYKLSIANAPKADINQDDKTPEEQTELLESLEDPGPIIGVTIVKRLVPGWFFKTEVGTDIINLGLSVEF